MKEGACDFHAYRVTASSTMTSKEGFALSRRRQEALEAAPEQRYDSVPPRTPLNRMPNQPRTNLTPRTPTKKAPLREQRGFVR